VRNLFRRQDRGPKTQEQEQLDQAVQKTKEGAFYRITGLFKQQIITEDTWEQLEDYLIQADVGPITSYGRGGRDRRAPADGGDPGQR